MTDGTNTATLVQNTYDYLALSSVTGAYEHDPAYTTSFTARGNISVSSKPALYTVYYYDMTGNVTSTSVNGVTSNLTTNSTTNYAAPSQVTTNTLNSSMTYSNFLGISSSTDPNNDTGSIAYAGFRPGTVTSPYGAVTNYTYNDTASPPNAIANTNGHWVETVMDGFGRTVQTITGYGSTTLSTVDTQYAPCGCSPLGKMSQQSQPYAPGGSDAWVVHHYDASGRTTSLVQPDGSTTSYYYRGNNVLVYDPAGNWKSFLMDAFGNLVDVWEPDPVLGIVGTGYSYDVLNHLIQVYMPRGSTSQVRTFNYNTGTHGTTVGGTLQSTTNPENGTVSYTYDTSSLLRSKTDAKGQQLTYQYDGYNRLTSITWANAPGGAQVLRTYFYDGTVPDNSSFSQNALGRLSAVQYPSLAPNTGNGIENAIQINDMYSYVPAGTAGAGLPVTKRVQINQPVYYLDINNRKQQKTVTVNLDSGYGYNNEGKLTAITYPSTINNQGASSPGASYNYSYDSMYRLSGMTDSNQNTIVSGVSYNAANQLLTMNFPGANEHRYYNVLGQLTQILASGVENIVYNYPTGTNTGKISSMYNAVSGETVTYTYDSLNRLATANGSGWGEQYTFDPFGNLTAKTVTSGSGPSMSLNINQSNNQIQQSGFGYDANGNAYTTNGSASVTAYDVENHISGVGWNNYAEPAQYYAYDAQGKRTYTWAENIDSLGNQTEYTINYYSITGQKLGSYQCMPGQTYPLNGEYAPFIAVTLQSSDQYFGARRLATVDQLGSVGSYYPWGEAKGTTNPQDTWSYATYWRDSATNLDYAQNRYYSNAYARFMTPDPSWRSVDLKNPQTWNRYAYVVGDPVNSNDPSGLDGFDDGGDGLCPNIALAECGYYPDSPMPLPPGASYPYPIPTSIDYPINDGAGFTGSLDINLTNGSMAFQFSPGSGGVLVGLCIAQPELCGAVIVGGVITIYVVEQYGPALFTALSNALGSSSWKAGSFPTVQEVQANCTPVGGPVVVPSTRKGNAGGTSTEQQYLCPDGNNYTVHTIADKNGKIIDIHVRPGGPKYGSDDE